MTNPLATYGQNLDIISGTGIQTENNALMVGGNANSYGDFGSTPQTLFRVTGVVAVKIYAIVQVSLVSGGGGSVEVGTATSPTGLIASATASALTAHKSWWNGSPAAIAPSTDFLEFVIDEDIILTTTTANITAGRIRFMVMYRPLSQDGSLVATSTGDISGSTSQSPSSSASSSLSPSSSNSPSISPSASVSPSASRSPSSSVSSSFSASVSPSSSLSPSSSSSSSTSPSSSQSPSASSSSSQSPSSSRSPSASTSPSSSNSPSGSQSATPSSSLSPSASTSPSSSSSASRSPSSSLSPSASASPS